MTEKSSQKNSVKPVTTSCTTSSEKDVTGHVEVINRLKRATNTKSDTALSEALGVKQSSISSAKQRQEVPSKWITKVSLEYGVSADWLLYGTGETKTKGEGYESENQEGTKQAPELRMIPKVLARLNAGGGSLETSENVQGMYGFRYDWIKTKGDPSKMVLMDVSGDSMTPEIRDGDTVLIDQDQKDVFVGKIYAVSIDQEIVVKYVEKLPGKLVLRSVNRKWNDIEVDIRGDLGDSVQIIGRVVWLGRELT